MVRSNLAVLLAERGRSITSVSRATGISRTTLTALEKNRAAGIQFDTINRLCSHLRVKPSDIIAFIPFEMDVVKIKPQETPELEECSVQYSEDISFNITDQASGVEHGIDFRSKTYATVDDGVLNVSLTLSLSENQSTTLEQIRALFAQIPPAFIASAEYEFTVRHSVISTPMLDMREKFECSSLRYTVNWPAEILFY